MPWRYRQRRAALDGWAGRPAGALQQDRGATHARLAAGLQHPGTFASVVVTANGRRIDLPDGATVATLIDRMGLTGRVVVVERNGEPVDRRAVTTTVLTDGDRCEVVRAVAGG